jgi:hypothetical protein
MCPNRTLLEKADFDPFVWTDHTGQTRFANQMSGGHRFLDPGLGLCSGAFPAARPAAASS